MSELALKEDAMQPLQLQGEVEQTAPEHLAPAVKITAPAPTAGNFKLDADAMKLCKVLTHSSFMPANLRSTPEKDKSAECFHIAMMGRELGLSPWVSFYGIYCVDGQMPALYAKTKLALVQRAGGKVSISYDDETQTAFCTITRPDTGATISECFSAEDAASKGKMYLDATTGRYVGIKSDKGKPTPWSQDPRKMLTWRAIGRACDFAYADVLMGFATQEDLEDMSQAPITIKVNPTQDADAAQLPQFTAAPTQDLASIIKE